MKKRFLVAAMAATLVSPIAAYANATVYGNAHVSINSFDSADNLDMSSNTSSIGVKGKEDLGGGMTALFKLEWQVDVTERNNASGTANLVDGKVKTKAALVDRDQWVGLKSGMGTVKFGTMSSNYKQMGGKIDPMYRTVLEGRGFMKTQSSLHGGAGQDGGRMTNTVQLTSSKMGGMQAVFNMSVSGADDETMGLGVRYKAKNMMAYFDYLDTQTKAAVGEAAIKVGGSYTMDALTIGAQFEQTEDALGADVVFLSANYKMNDNDNVAFTFGDNDSDDAGYAFLYNHKMSKRTNVYAGYGDNASNTAADDQVVTAGIRHKF